jgi:hypothetical protein
VKPEFVDNRELTMADALCGHLDWLDAAYKSPAELSIATGYFNAEGFAIVADRLEKLTRVRLLLGAEPIPPAARPLRAPGDPTGPKFEAKLVHDGLERNAAGMLRDRNLLEFEPGTERAVSRLLEFLKSGIIEVKRYEEAFLHGKAFLFGTDLFGTGEGVIAGSSNFTAAGLTCNLELNLGRYDPTPVEKVREWFEALWDKARPYDLASVYQARFEEYPPYLIYLRVLWERYRGEVEEEAGPGSRIHLTTFQTDGIFRAKRILEKHNGVLIADAVGLGKTFIGGELIRETVEDKRQRALLISPAALRDGTWASFRDRHQLYLECVSYEELANDKQLGGAYSYLGQRIRDYELIVVDEAQAFRNPETVRGRALRKLLEGDPPKKLVLMSATPVNNSLWDLYYLLNYFVRQDAVFAEQGIRSLKDRFHEAMNEDPDSLQPDVLFDVLDATTVRRTRSFVGRYYPNDKVRGPNGIEVPIQFPKPHLKRVDYSLDSLLPGFFGEFAQALMPEDGPPLLTMARYLPSSYVKNSGENASEAALVGLVRSGLLKRFESSVHAFASTLRKLVSGHNAFLDGLDRGVVLNAEAIAEWSQVDSDEALDELLAHTGSESSKGFDTKRLRADVQQDRDLLADFEARVSKIGRDQDPKLQRLVEKGLKPILKQARKEAANDDELRLKRKVLIFTYYADTVDWITSYLQERFDKDPMLKPYRGRLVSVAGEETDLGISRKEAVFGFAPGSSEAPAGLDEDQFDVMVTTDVLAEGMNLQDCRNIINYDLPWNPMRLVQRHGRIDRIGSPHKDVYIWCFFPDHRLEELLDLERRIRHKVAQAAATVGVEHEVIPGAATSDRVFTETVEEIERLKAQDPSLLETAGERAGTQSGEAYRQELRKGLENYGKEIEDLPWGSGSGFVGPRAGHLFCARVGDRSFLRFVPRGDEVILRDSLACLRTIACTEKTERFLDPDGRERAYSAWSRARRDIYNEWQFSTDPANLQPKIRPLLRRAAELVRKHPVAGIEQGQLDRIVDSIEAPWGARIENQIREAMGDLATSESSARVIDVVRRLGLQPFQAPEPLPPIAVEEVRLICWMAIQSTASESTNGF